MKITTQKLEVANGVKSILKSLHVMKNSESAISH